MAAIHRKFVGLFLVACFAGVITAMAGLQKDIQQEIDNNPFLKEQGLSVRVTEADGYVTLEVADGNREVREMIYKGVDISSIAGSAIAMDMYDLDKSASETLSALNRTIKRIEKMGDVKEVVVKALINTEKDRLADKQRELARAYNEGLEYYKSMMMDRAFSEFMRAADQGHAGAQYYVGTMYHVGQGVPKDLVRALEWLQKSADNGNANAFIELGVMYYKGDGVDKNINAAITHITEAAKRGLASAQNNLGSLYSSGKDVPLNKPAAFEWYKKAADGGDATAQASVATMYMEGQGVVTNLGLALEWAQKAAAQGNALGQRSVGVIYASGLGVATNEPLAVKWLTSAANQGDAPAIVLLAYIFASSQNADLRDTSRALELIKSVAAKLPDHWKIYRTMGLAYAGEGDDEQALQAYEKCRSLLQQADLAPTQKEEQLGRIEADIEKCRKEVAEERADKDSWAQLVEDSKDIGSEINSFACQTSASEKSLITIHERGIVLVEQLRWSADPVRTNTLWYGNLYSIKFSPRGEEGLRSPFNPQEERRGPPEVRIQTTEISSLAGATLRFGSQQECIDFMQAFTAAHQKWAGKIASNNTTAVVAEPGRWSRKIMVKGFPFNLAIAADDVRGGYEVRSANGVVNRISSEEDGIEYTDWFQLRSAEKRPICILAKRINLIDKTEPEDKAASGTGAPPAAGTPGPNTGRQAQGGDIAGGQKHEVREKPIAVAQNNQRSATIEGIWKGSARGSDGLFKKADYEHEITISKQQPFVWVRTGGSTKYAKWVYAVLSSDVNQVSAVYDEGTVRSKVVFSMAPSDPYRAKLVETLYRLRPGDDPMYIREDVYQLQRAP